MDTSVKVREISNCFRRMKRVPSLYISVHLTIKSIFKINKNINSKIIDKIIDNISMVISASHF